MKSRIVGIALVCFASTACNSSVEPVDITETGALEDGDPVLAEQDGSAYDEYTFRAAEGMQIAIEMSSEEFDTFLWLNGPDGANLQQNDDGPDGTTNSRIEAVAPATGTYTVWANALYGKDDCDDDDPDCWGGPYSLRITTTPAE